MLLLLSQAWAGACCIGTVSSVPAWMGECETTMVGAGMGTEVGVGRWDHQGAVDGASGSDVALTGSVAAGWRFTRAGFLTVDSPLRHTWRSAGSLEGDGGGLGDIRTTVMLDPVTEQINDDGSFGAPIPLIGVGVRLPTGTTWETSDEPLMADVTGTPGPSVSALAGLQRTLGDVPWALVAEVERDEHTTLAATATVGNYLGNAWTVVGLARHARVMGDHPSSRTSLGARLVHGAPVRWRAWVGAQTDIPLPGLGQDNPRMVSASMGAALVR